MMNFKIREVKLKTGKVAVQVYTIVNRKRNILKHLGSSDNEAEIKDLKEQAGNWIREEMGRNGLFQDAQDTFFKNYKYLGFSYKFAYDFLSKSFNDFNFHNHTKKLFKDLCIAQILEPSSKRQNLLFLEKFFEVRHNLNNLYEYLSAYDSNLKDNLEKEVEKAKIYENSESTKLRKMKFLKNNKTIYYLDQDLIDKNTKLLGLKGYITNLQLPNDEIVNYYHNLFKIEHAFRIAKSDLEIRPIYHFKEQSIKNHLLICFVCLSLSVFLELKNKKSIKCMVDLLKNVTDAKMHNLKTGKTFYVRSEITQETRNLLH